MSLIQLYRRLTHHLSRKRFDRSHKLRIYKHMPDHQELVEAQQVYVLSDEVLDVVWMDEL